MTDEYAHYEVGLQKLLEQLGNGHPRYRDALVYQQRLTENIKATRRHGDTETRRADRSAISYQLNALAGETLNQSFNDLCGQNEGAASTGTSLWTTESFEPETVRVPAGTFTMGDDEDPHAAPQHEVTLPAFRIGRRPVTNSQYHYYLRQEKKSAPPELRWVKGTRPSPEQEDEPVCGVTWHEALEYCNWLSTSTAHTYTLPSETQWERTVQEDMASAIVPSDLREWTTSLWGENRRKPDERYRYPLRPDDERDDLTVNDQVRRVTRGGTSSPTRRTPEYPNSRGLLDDTVGFRIVSSTEGEK